MIDKSVEIPVRCVLTYSANLPVHGHLGVGIVLLLRGFDAKVRFFASKVQLQTDDDGKVWLEGDCDCPGLGVLGFDATQDSLKCYLEHKPLPARFHVVSEETEKKV